jgi:PST family polysaccharide transporter
LKLGLVFLASGLLMMGAAYAIRTIILRQLGLEAAGFYQSAWALGGMYVGIVLQAMGADFYPRLTASAEISAECNRLVNEQAQVSLLLAGPGVLTTLTFAPLVIAVFYTPQFVAAVEPLRWICLGMALRVVIWPVGYIIVARGRQAMLFWTEVLAAVAHVGLAWLAVGPFGVSGAGMAFVGMYLVHGSVVYLLVRRMTGFRWSAANRRVGFVVLGLMAAVFSCFQLLPFWAATAAGMAALLFSLAYSLRRLSRLVPLERLPGWLQRIIARCRFVPGFRGES